VTEGGRERGGGGGRREEGEEGGGGRGEEGGGRGRRRGEGVHVLSMGWGILDVMYVPPQETTNGLLCIQACLVVHVVSSLTGTLTWKSLFAVALSAAEGREVRVFFRGAKVQLSTGCFHLGLSEEEATWNTS